LIDVPAGTEWSAGWDGIGGRGTIVPMALNYTQQKALAMQWKAAENPS
jgi:hypothetical protein